MQNILFEDHSHSHLLPLTWTRPLYDLRIGIDTLREKWARALGYQPGACAYDYLGEKYNDFTHGTEAMWWNGKFIPSAALIREWILALGSEGFLTNHIGEVLCARFDPGRLGTEAGKEFSREGLLSLGLSEMSLPASDVKAIRYLPDLFLLNGACIREDFAYFRSLKASQPILDPHTRVYCPENIFIGEGVRIRAAILNAEDGPIYLADGVEVEEGAIIHGAHAICEHSVVKMGAKFRGDTTIGPWCKVGGEVANSVVMGWSNKGHDGYLGNSVLGHWCNLGADTNTSNLKNNYAEVKLWNYPEGRFRKTGTQFCGLIMGDHSKCGINTMFNTGTVVGVSANIFGSGYPRNFIPSFSWGGASGFTTFALKQALEVAKIVMERRKVKLDEIEIRLMENVFRLSGQYRNYDR